MVNNVPHMTGTLGRLPRLAETVEVEVDVGGGVVWKRAEVRRLLAQQRFRVVVDGDEVAVCVTPT